MNNTPPFQDRLNFILSNIATINIEFNVEIKGICYVLQKIDAELNAAGVRTDDIAPNWENHSSNINRHLRRHFNPNPLIREEYRSPIRGNAMGYSSPSEIIGLSKSPTVEANRPLPIFQPRRGDIKAPFAIMDGKENAIDLKNPMRTFLPIPDPATPVPFVPNFIEKKLRKKKGVRHPYVTSVNARPHLGDPPISSVHIPLHGRNPDIVAHNTLPSHERQRRGLLLGAHTIKQFGRASDAYEERLKYEAKEKKKNKNKKKQSQNLEARFLERDPQYVPANHRIAEEIAQKYSRRPEYVPANHRIAEEIAQKYSRRPGYVPANHRIAEEIAQKY
jgi:hypothetical protein